MGGGERLTGPAVLRLPSAATLPPAVHIGGVPPERSLYSASHFIPLSDDSQEPEYFDGITHRTGLNQVGRINRDVVRVRGSGRHVRKCDGVRPKVHE
ncbi:hypothetical protein [Streptomyces sp. HB132]|uniref:hypothetical protein n=1 Tax=Streptomyces sp. HB132 TaxID=767388 RepID=UPI0019612131|nr:hypothetical protein [Streptomyces sp. HB132]MBM7442705.1 hypothetical protein [Streptomyces sp. HB132]